MLRATGDAALSLTAYNSGGDPAGLRTALGWFSLGFPLAISYFVLVFRLHRGKAVADGDGYYVRGGIIVVPKGGVIRSGTVV